MAWMVGHIVLNSKTQQWLVPLLFASTGDLVMGLIWLAPNLRQVEREMGSRQWLVWVGWVAGFGFITYAIVGDDEGGGGGGTGRMAGSLPNFILGATLAHYLKFVPRLHPKFVGVLGMNFSEKALQCLWASYVLSHGGWTSILQGGIGLIGSFLYFGLVPRYLPLSIPKIVAEALPWESLGSLLLLDPPSKVYVPLMMQNIGGGRHSGGRQRGAAANAEQQLQRPQVPMPIPVPAAVSPPSQEVIEQLTAMGFDEERVRQALLATNNSVERAANLLLMG
jgi:UBA/TS-N domain